MAQEIPVHGISHDADPVLLSTHVVADSVTALSYFFIAGALAWLVYRLRRELPFSAMFLLFGAFIVLCGGTHLVAMLSLKWQLPWVAATLSIVTASVSLMTAVLLPKQLPLVQKLVRDAVTARERERAHARAEALAEANSVLESQANALAHTNSLLIASMAQRDALERQLQQSQKMEVMGRLASGVAHDFNNLLTVIQVNVERAQLELGDCAERDTVDGTLDDVRKATASAAQLTRRLLAFSREDGVARSAMSLDAMLADDERFYRGALPGSVRVELALGAAGARVEVNPTQLQQAVLNLLVNARDAVRAHGTIRISTAHTDVQSAVETTVPALGEGRYATITVRDDGIGMSEEIRARLFEPFFTTKPAGEGTGLGLAMVYDTIVKHGGAVGVSSSPGEGSSFTLYLPLAA